MTTEETPLPIGEPLPKSEAEPTRFVRVPLIVLQRMEQLEGDLDFYAAQLRRVSTTVADHDQRLHNVEVDVNDLQRRHAMAMRKLDDAHHIATELLADLTDPLRLMAGKEK